MKISVIGCGYLGAVHAACMAKLGHDVVGIDVDKARVAALNEGHAPFYEPGFEEVLASQLAAGRLRFTDSTDSANQAHVHFLAVGTPQSADGIAADLTYVHAAVDALIEAGATGLVVGKSTVPVGTAAELQKSLAGSGLELVWNPEFLREGHAVKDTLRPDRIVYGVDSVGAGTGDVAAGAAVLDEVYAELLAAGVPRLVTDYATAELVKVAANSFLATKISFINAMAELCEATGGDVVQLADAIGYDERIGRKFLGAGIGFGGGCLPKDIRAFTARAEELGVGDAVGFLKEVDAINTRRMDRVVDACVERFAWQGGLKGARIAVLGGAFKANSDDIRESPALIIARRLVDKGADVRLYDPQAMANIAQRAPQVPLAASTADALRGAEMTLVLTEWQEFKDLDPATAGELVERPIVLDGRNILDPAAWRGAGWDYLGMGR